MLYFPTKKRRKFGRIQFGIVGRLARFCETEIKLNKFMNKSFLLCLHYNIYPSFFSSSLTPSYLFGSFCCFGNKTNYNVWEISHNDKTYQIRKTVDASSMDQSVINWHDKVILVNSEGFNNQKFPQLGSVQFNTV